MLSLLRHLPLFALVATLLPASLIQAQAKEFRWGGKPGDEYSIDMVQTMRQSLKTGETTTETQTEINMYATWRLESINKEGQLLVAETIDRMKIRIVGPDGKEIKVDSAQEEAPAGQEKMADMLKAFVGVKFERLMDPRGKILEVTLPEETKKALAGNPISPDMLKEMVSKYSPVFPAEKIEPNFRWESKNTTKTPVGAMTLFADYIYVGEVQQDGRTLDKFDIGMNMEFEKGAIPGVDLSLEDQNHSGAIFFDPEIQWMRESRASQDFTVVVKAADGEARNRMINDLKIVLTPKKK